MTHMSELGHEHSDCLKAKTSWLDAFGLRVQSLERADIDLREGELLVLFRLEHQSEKYPNKGLSGGEKRRVTPALT